LEFLAEEEEEEEEEQTLARKEVHTVLEEYSPVPDSLDPH
jgi:hypothetical protein